MRKEDTSEIQFAELEDDIVVLRVIGRGTFQNSIALENLDRHYELRQKPARYILDLDRCQYMDSTFMGVLAYVGSQQLQRTDSRMTVLNLSKHARKLLTTLGLTNILEVKGGACPGRDEQFDDANAPELDRYQQTAHILQAHERLIALDGENEVKFQNVIQTLQASLQRATPLAQSTAAPHDQSE